MHTVQLFSSFELYILPFLPISFLSHVLIALSKHDAAVRKSLHMAATQKENHMKDIKDVVMNLQVGDV